MTRSRSSIARHCLCLAALLVAPGADAGQPTRYSYTVSSDAPLAASREPLAVVVVAPQRTALMAMPNEGIPLDGHAMWNHFGGSVRWDEHLVANSDGATPANFAEAGAAAVGMVALQNRTADKRSSALVQHVGPLLDDDLAPMLLDVAALALADSPLGTPSVYGMDDRETAPEGIGRTLWLVGAHQFTYDTRYLLVHVFATMCDGRHVTNDACTPIYRNELTYAMFVPEVAKVKQKEKRARAWAALGQDDIDGRLRAAFTELLAMFEYDIANLGREKSTPIVKRVPDLERMVLNRPLGRFGERDWSRSLRGALYSTDRAMPPN